MARFRLGLGPRRVERDVDAELAFHLDMRARRLVERGTGARRRPRPRRCGSSATGTACEPSWWPWTPSGRRPCAAPTSSPSCGRTRVYAVRALRHNLGFALVVVLSLAVGIGANTAIFTLIDALLLRPLPVPDADELVVIGDPGRTSSVSEGSLRTDLFSYPLYADLSRDPPLLQRSGRDRPGRAARSHGRRRARRRAGERRSTRAAASSAATTSRCSACRR